MIKRALRTIADAFRMYFLYRKYVAEKYLREKDIFSHVDIS